MSRLHVAVAVVAAATALLTGCAQPGGAGPAASPAATVDPSASPDKITTPEAPPATNGSGGGGGSVPPVPGNKPPKDPTDPMPSDILAGRVTKGGTGPCYGMETDDGKVYALFWGEGVTLTAGQTVLVWFEQMRVLVDCGPGTPVSVVKLEIVG
jgi:hypothetical protein